MGPDDTIRSPHATLPWQKAAHKAGSTAKPRCASSNPTDAKITLSPPPLVQNLHRTRVSGSTYVHTYTDGAEQFAT